LAAAGIHARFHDPVDDSAFLKRASSPQARQVGAPVLSRRVAAP
jgi:hypothetical protein